MPEQVDLYNTSYGNAETEVYSEVRRETYGVDLGQTSWASQEEFAEIPRLLQLNSASHALEIGCGAGGCALHFAATVGCSVTGIDVNAHGIRNGQQSAGAAQLQQRVRFIEHNAATPLPFSEESFDAIYSNDAFCHIPNRLGLLRECRRVLKPGSLMLFSDALVISGVLSNEELAARSSIGYYLFVPPGENERLIREAGLTLQDARDTTPQAALLSVRWRDARARRKDALAKVEGEANFEGLQKFLDCVHTLTSEHRLSRFIYIAARKCGIL
jgi:cyclopropane fatty-acyl-phospholipid synthase-like methyltransferase